MLTKAIVEEIISQYEVKVRIPILDGAATSSNSTNSYNLTIAHVCVLPQMNYSFAVGDVVYVMFEDNDTGRPVIVGCLAKPTGNDSQINMTLGTINIEGKASLSEQTSIGEISYQDLLNVKEPFSNVVETTDFISENAVYHDDGASAPEQTLLDNYYTKSQTLNACYPIGSYFMTDSEDFNTVTKVQNYFGGTWTQITQTSFYTQYKWGKTTISKGNTISHSLTITTSGNPVYLNINGDNNPLNQDNDNWIRMDIKRDGNILARQISQSNRGSQNIPFALSYLDIVSAGTYTYTFEIYAGGGQIELGEDGNYQAPQCMAYEIGGNKGSPAKYVYKRLS